MRAGVFGLGSMGYGIASSLLRAGHEVCGADVDPQRVTRLQSEGALAASINHIAAELDAVVIVALNADQTEAVLFGEDGIVSRLRKGAVVICFVTVAPAFAREMAVRCAERSVHYLDAPISGGSVKAAAGKLSILASGTPDAFESAGPVLTATACATTELIRR